MRVTVKPSTAGPGGEVEIQVEGCKGHSAVAKSRAFAANADLARRAFGEEYNLDQAETARNPDYAVPLRGHVKVKPSATPGRYEINVTCDGRDHASSGSFEVVHDGRSDGGRDGGRGHDRDHDRDRDRGWDQDRRDHERPEHERSDHDKTPYAPVRAGGGGTATHLAASSDAVKADADKKAEAASTGPGTQHAVIGLVLAGVAAVSVAFRSVRRQRTASRDAD
ncbi:hypothetical protein DVH02_16575 [Streptomyces corynorhini]|uniref:Uncharacterized protein n=1 Tax=Streptomyces corynorhini TaxID=2282652 RepID=A0A370BAC9_9ACTN|nr:hypothetical protein DVH02_16575 [Streptomyces corynorhini]